MVLALFNSREEVLSSGGGVGPKGCCNCVDNDADCLNISWFIMNTAHRNTPWLLYTQQMGHPVTHSLALRNALLTLLLALWFLTICRLSSKAL
jgi:hypothetical protein